MDIHGDLFYFYPMSIVLFDEPEIRLDLMPFTLTRPVSCIRVGILTIAEKWGKHFATKVFHKTSGYLQKKYGIPDLKDALYINGGLCPSPALVSKIKTLKNNESLLGDSMILAYIGTGKGERIQFEGEFTLISKPWHIFQKNGAEIKADFALITAGRTSNGINDKHTITYNEELIFVEKGAKIKASVINAEAGPVYIGPNSEIQEGSVIRGPFSLGVNSVINMGGKMRGDTSIGPYSKVGGEISNSVIFGYSNKAHDGFLGNSVIGEWCNLGADTNTSNLKNNYGEISIHNFKTNKTTNTGLQFCGTLMGDHSKTSINTMINTGTVVGVCANIFGHGFPPKYIPSFSWGGSGGFEKFHLEKAIEVAKKMMGRRGIEVSPVDEEILKFIYENPDGEPH